MIRTSFLATVLAAGALSQPAPDRNTGRKIFESQCAVCHGVNGAGGRGPGLNRPKLTKAASDEQIRKIIRDGLPPEMPGAWQLSENEVAAVSAFVVSLGSVPQELVPGDPIRGAELFRTNGCQGCHITKGEGRGFGPELTAIATRRGASHLRESLTNPGAFVAEEYRVVEAVTPAGTIRGIRLNEDSFHIQIRDSAGRLHSMRKASLKELRKLPDQSTMPSYAQSLSPAGLDNLVSFLATLRGVE